MSGPFAPPQNKAKPPKRLGQDRVPRSADVPQRNPGIARVLAARKLGVDPAAVTEAPGMRPRASSAPRPQAVPVRAPVTPRPVSPMQDVPLPAQPPPQSRFPPPNSGAPAAPTVPQKAPQAQYGWKPAAGGNFPPVTGPVTGASVGPPKLQGGVAPNGTHQSLVEAIAAAHMNQAKDQIQSNRIAQAQGGNNPNSLLSPKPIASEGSVVPPEATNPSPQNYKPTESIFKGYYKREGEKDKKGKIKEGKAMAKSPNFYYYDALGVPHDNRLASAALTKLRQKQIDEPENLTEAEDRILASSGNTPADNLSLEPAAVKERFARYQEKKGSAKAVPRAKDRAPGAPAGNELPIDKTKVLPSSKSAEELANQAIQNPKDDSNDE